MFLKQLAKSTVALHTNPSSMYQLHLLCSTRYHEFQIGWCLVPESCTMGTANGDNTLTTWLMSANPASMGLKAFLKCSLYIYSSLFKLHTDPAGRSSVAASNCWTSAWAAGQNNSLCGPLQRLQECGDEWYRRAQSSFSIPTSTFCSVSLSASIHSMSVGDRLRFPLPLIAAQADINWAFFPSLWFCLFCLSFSFLMLRLALWHAQQPRLPILLDPWLTRDFPRTVYEHFEDHEYHEKKDLN